MFVVLLVEVAVAEEDFETAVEFRLVFVHEFEEDGGNCADQFEEDGQGYYEEEDSVLSGVVLVLQLRGDVVGVVDGAERNDSK